MRERVTKRRRRIIFTVFVAVNKRRAPARQPLFPILLITVENGLHMLLIDFGDLDFVRLGCITAQFLGEIAVKIPKGRPPIPPNAINTGAGI